MMHLTDEQIYNLAKKTNDYISYNKEEKEQLIHMKTCADCYNSFAGILVLMEALEPDGAFKYMQQDNPLTVIEKILAVVEVTFKKIGNSVSSKMEQLPRFGRTLTFVPGFIGNMRSVEDEDRSMQLDEIGAEKTYIFYDGKDKELFIQVDGSGMDYDSVAVEVMFENKIPVKAEMMNVNGIYSGVIRDVPEDNFRVFIQGK